MKREFFIDTPLGKLRVWAKHDEDNPKDFPGVYVDLVRDGEDDEMLACIEYESCDGVLQGVLYQLGCDEPEYILKYDNQD